MPGTSQSSELAAGVDIGTTSVKGLLVDRDGRAVARTRRPSALRVGAGGRFEHEALSTWWDGPRLALADLAQAGGRPAAVAVSAMMPSVAAVSAAGQPLGPGLLYGDGRGAPDGPGPVDPLASPEMARLAEWLSSSSEGAGAHGFWPAQAVANAALGADGVIDLATAFACGPLYNGSGWDPVACRSARLEPAQLPRVVVFGEAVGEVSPSSGRLPDHKGRRARAGHAGAGLERARSTGLQRAGGAGLERAGGAGLEGAGGTGLEGAAGTGLEGAGLRGTQEAAGSGPPRGSNRVDGSAGAVLAAGSVDGLCEQLVAGAVEDGDVLVGLGSTLVVWLTVPGWPDGPPGLWRVPHVVGGKAMVGGASNAGGLWVDWARKLFVPAHGAGVTVGTALAPGNVPVWWPWVRGERVPWHDPSLRVALEGADMSQGPAAFMRAALEASAFVVRYLTERASTCGTAPARFIVSGGGVRDRDWLQALADVLARPVSPLAVPETAALGAAFLARMGAGLETSLDDARRWARWDVPVEPDPRWAGPVGERYGRWREHLPR